MANLNSLSKGDAVVVGGSNGVGLATAMHLAKYCKVYIIDRVAPDIDIPSNVEFVKFDLMWNDFSIFDTLLSIDKLVITAGFGRLSLFENFTEEEIERTMRVNATSVMQIIKRYYPLMLSKKDFYTSVMVSIAGFISSPLFAVYGASKAALKIFIESVNVELLKHGTKNQILNVSPGALRGTNFNGTGNDLPLLEPFITEMVNRMMKKEDLYIPQYDEIFKQVLERYNEDFRAEGARSYDYKMKNRL